jgi:hypothetical protein
MDPNAPPDEEPPMEISPEADAAMQELVELFSDPSLRSKARLRCPVEGPDEFDVLFESIIDDQFGHDPNSEYKQWVRRLYRLGFISRIPDDWQDVRLRRWRWLDAFIRHTTQLGFVIIATALGLLFPPRHFWPPPDYIDSVSILTGGGVPDQHIRIPPEKSPSVSRQRKYAPTPMDTGGGV